MLANIGKKFLSIVFALMLVLGMGLPLNAAGTAEDPEGEAQRDVGEQPAYGQDVDEQPEEEHEENANYRYAPQGYEEPEENNEYDENDEYQQ